MRRDFAQTNRLRTEGTRNLLYAAEQGGAKRIITAGLACIYEPNTWVPATEVTPLWRDPPRQFAPVLAALRSLEDRTRQTAWYCAWDSSTATARSTGDMDHSPVMYRPGRCRSSAPATALSPSPTSTTPPRPSLPALHSQVRGALNLVDDEPAPVREWLPSRATC
jgi:hypothetical protein